MRLFSRRFGRYTAVFEQTEATLISDLVDQVRQMLAGRRAESSADPLARMTGMMIAPGTPPADPALARLLPDFHATDAEMAAGIRMLREPDLIALKDASAVKLLDSLPRGGGTVHLDVDGAQAWISTLNDVRLALGVRLDIQDDEFEPSPDADPEGMEMAIFATYRWLSAVQDSLVTALLG
ncbi:hypothetical protein ABIB25_001178 [Nakamurella sp. UYEF19]|uniref:DUF2017 domain-containing protein n=1 Tax=Nakamurella sp. UYEF19 TaxID=1756392 RepID=UPI003394A6BB